MTMQEYEQNIRELLNSAGEKIALPVMVPSGNELLANLKNRIIREGKNTNGQKIGNYSTKPAYYTRNQFDRKSSFKGRGKNSNRDFANGKKRQSMYFSNGYKGLRDVQGKPTNHVNLNYTGDTMAAYQQRANDDGVVQGMVSKEASTIRKGNEDRMDMDIYSPSQQEINDYKKNVTEGIIEVTTKIIKGASA